MQNTRLQLEFGHQVVVNLRFYFSIAQVRRHPNDAMFGLPHQLVYLRGAPWEGADNRHIFSIDITLFTRREIRFHDL